MRALITTTINVPHNLAAWRQHLSKDDIVVVTGDKKTPDTDVREFLETLPGVNIYLDAEAQKIAYPSVSETTGWNCIQRRNIAVLKAMEFDPTTITTVDDDNYPVGDDWFGQLDEVMSYASRPLLSSYSGWFNPGTLCVPPVTHRGYPLSERHAPYEAPEFLQGINIAAVGVFASLWLGDPDIDAVERIAIDPWIGSVTTGVTLAAGTWAPFNSQATTVVGELAPLLFMWPGVGRYDDIWASYLARAIMDIRGWHVGYGHPLVKQSRNEHDLVKDLKAEMFGMEYNERVIALLRHPMPDNVINSSAGINHLMREYMRRFHVHDWMPVQVSRAYDAWYNTVAEIEKVRYATS